MTLYILTLDIENEGLSSSAHRTREGARTALYDYVRRNWEAEMSVECPEDREQAVDDYSNESEDRAEIEEVELVD